MPFVEVFASGVPEERKRLICEHLVAIVIEGQVAPDRRVVPQVWREVSGWSIGKQPVVPSEAPNYQVRISVPAGWLTQQRNAQIIRHVTAVLAATGDQPHRLHQNPSPGCRSTTSPKARRAWPAGAVARDHRLRHDRRRRPQLAISNCCGIDQ
jgi:hypothetical protein